MSVTADGLQVNRYMYEILVPATLTLQDEPDTIPQWVRWDEGNETWKIRRRRHRQWDEFVLSLTGGLTILRPSKGKWVHPEGTLLEEVMIPVKVCCTHEQMQEIAEFTLNHYLQDAILFYRTSSEVVIYHAKPVRDKWLQNA